MATGGADVNLGIDIEKKGQGDKEAAAGLELVAHAADSAKDELAQLDRKLVETRLAMVAAGKEFARTGDISPFKALLKDERQLSQVSKTLSRLTSDLKTDLGKGVESGIVEGGQSGLRSLAPGAGQAIAAGIVLAAPAISGALAAAVGAGGIAAGIVLAARDPRVSAAWGMVGHQAMTELSGAASPFIGVLIRGSQTFAAMLDRILPSIRRDFAELAPIAERLFGGAAGFVERLMPGIDALVRASGPVLSMLAQELPRLGAAISTAFQSIASAGQGGKEALQDLLRLTEGSIVVFGKLLEITERVYAADRALVQQLFARDSQGAINSMAAALTTTKDANVGLADSIHIAAEAARGSNLAYAGVAEKLRDTQAAAAALRAELDKIINSSLGLAGATLQLTQDEAGLAGQFKAHGSALQGNTANALSNQQAILGLARDLEATRQAEIQHGATLQEANAHLQANAGKLYDMAAAAGFDRDQVRALIESMLGIPNVNRTITINEVRTHTDIYRTIDQSGNLVGGSPYLRSASQLGLQAFGGIVGAARGLIASKGPTVVFGERSLPEAYIPSRNSGISQGRADMLLGTAASWWGRRLAPAGGGGGRSLTVNVYAGWGANGAEIGQQVAQVISRQIRTDPAFAATIAGAST